jgi:hypothetical protein
MVGCSAEKLQEINPFEHRPLLLAQANYCHLSHTSVVKQIVRVIRNVPVMIGWPDGDFTDMSSLRCSL